MRFIILLIAVLASGTPARADDQQRFGLGGGVFHQDNPSRTDFELGVEYEYRLNPGIGLGASGNSIFSNPVIGLLAVPELYLHPLAGEWYVSAAPLFELSNGHSSAGTRLGTRIPLPLGAITFVPSLTVDLISSRTNYIVGFGLEL